MHTFTVNDMVCGGCAANIVKAVQNFDPAAAVEADPASKRVTVESAKSSAEIAQVIAAAGYHAE
ncbi:MAG: heavy-metal-associated domain-containing protein [Methylobacillus sp.]|jgi:copper chaperone|nr:heavy-metal-associated domain-containing protein [Methylobacillus sp.]